MEKNVSSIDWEGMWAPYDEATYAAVLQHISLDDVVLEIGAGDFRLTRRIASRAKRIVAIERQQGLLDEHGVNLPANCHLIAGDAREVPFPSDVTTAVLLMRHCKHLPCYWRKLSAVSCGRLITNARWGLDVEIVNLREARQAFTAIELGWYACSCGQTGFVPGDTEAIDHQVMEKTWQVVNCPTCSS